MFYIKRNKEAEQITVYALYKMYKREELDESPYYQRFSDLWTIEKKRLLIDTIINGYDIPKFYFHYIISNENPLNKTNRKYAIIDGKQRVNALIEFIQNDFFLDETVKWLENPEIKFNKIKYSDLDNKKELYEVKTKIDNFLLDIIHVSTDEFDRIEEMFLRLNEGVPVNNAEKRNSIGGYLIEEINKFAKEADFFLNKVRFGNKRMEHQDLVAKLCLIEDSERIESFTKKNLDTLVKRYKPSKGTSESEKRILKAESQELLKRVEENLEIFNDIFDYKDEVLRYKGILPLYYLFIRENYGVAPKKFKDFIIAFDKARSENRKLSTKNTPNTTLLQFDRLNQQGAHQAKSLETRLKIMAFYYSKGKNSFHLEMPLKEIGIDTDNDSV